VSDPKEPQVRIVDRRWWARGESESVEPDDARERKPTVIEDLQGQLDRAHQQLQAVLTEHRRAADVDNLDRAIAAARGAAAADGSDTLLKGVELVRDLFLTKLEAFGVKRLPTLGGAFDPQLHEAVSMAPAADPAQHGMVTGVLKEGYVIGDDLLRPASVVVGSHE
jgi:hypothetical protein